jgi:hypothetical protein
MKPISPTQGSSVAEQEAHNPHDAGSIPAPAPKPAGSYTGHVREAAARTRIGRADVQRKWREVTRVEKRGRPRE